MQNEVRLPEQVGLKIEDGEQFKNKCIIIGRTRSGFKPRTRLENELGSSSAFAVTSYIYILYIIHMILMCMYKYTYIFRRSFIYIMSYQKGNNIAWMICTDWMNHYSHTTWFWVFSGSDGFTSHITRSTKLRSLSIARTSLWSTFIRESRQRKKDLRM